MSGIKESELVLNADGSLYHLRLHPGQLAPNILLVGDPGRADLVASFFDSIDIKAQNREIVTRTGTYHGKPISVVSTGMGTDNIDIVINEIDALFNMDLVARKPLEKHSSINLVRIGTSGGLQADVLPGSYLASSHGIGIDGMLHFYENIETIMDADITTAFIEQTQWPSTLPSPYAVPGDKALLDQLASDFKKGITLTAPGFYGPQGRVLRIGIAHPHLNESFERFSFNGMTISNFEMETSALYGLSKHLGHAACTICLIIANRVNGQFLADYKPAMNKLIHHVLDKLCV